MGRLIAGSTGAESARRGFEARARGQRRRPRGGAAGVRNVPPRLATELTASDLSGPGCRAQAPAITIAT
jgi:hypothetical protein